MRKKYRKAIYFSIGAITAPIWIILAVMGDLAQLYLRVMERLKTKLRVYDCDPD